MTAGRPGDRWDALVIGAGPAGSVAAATTASRGMRTLLVDRERFPRAKVCGGCLAPAGVRALEACGLDAPLACDRAPTLRTLRVVAPRAEAPLRIQPYLAVERARFDADLVGEACRRGATFRNQTSALLHPDNSVTLTVATRTRRAETLHPRVVIVADGIGGASLRERPEFRWRVSPRGPVGLGAVLDRRPPHATPDEITMACTPDGYVGVAPLPRDRWAIAAALSADLLRAAGPVAAIDTVLCHAGLAPAALSRESLRGTGALTRRRPRLAAGPVLLVGDAAGYAQPLTGEGMSWAIACAARIAPLAELGARGIDVSGAWQQSCRETLAQRLLLCRAVCAVASRPAALSALLRLAARFPTADSATSRLCWSAA